MKDKNTRETSSSRITWESLENWVRLKIQGWVQDLLFSEVTEPGTAACPSRPSSR